MTLITRRFLQTAALVATGVLLAACGKKDAPPAPAAAPVASAPAQAKVYVVGTDAAYAPFESQNEKGEIVGFDIDMLKAVAAKAGIEVKFVNTPWEGIFNALAQGDRDIVVSAVTITDERKGTMDFSQPYFDAQQLIAVRQDSKVAKFADLKKLKVGVQTGTTGDEAVTRLLGKTSTAIRRFESTPLALKELEAGGVDAVVADNGVVIHYVANNPGGKFKTVSRQGLRARAVRLRREEGQCRTAGQAGQGPGRYQGRRHLRPDLRQVLRCGAGRAGLARVGRSARPRRVEVALAGTGDGPALGDPGRLRAAVPERPVDDASSSRWWR
jgi:polar amino acid transport system substrate-binding protein